MDDQIIQFKLSASPQASGKFEVLAITAGLGNGWFFSAELLKQSLDKFDGVECFIDHDWFNRSVRDLAGILIDPSWSEEDQGILCTLKPAGPASTLLREVAHEMLTDDEDPGQVRGPRRVRLCRKGPRGP